PEDPSSGLFASWGPPRLGEPFILLAQESLIPDLQLLKDENLVDWEGDLRPTIPGWVEFHGFLAVSEAWDGVYTENAQLYQELRPRAVLSLSVFGGLRSPSGGWLEGCGPQVVVHGFEGRGRIIVQANTGSSIYEAPFVVNQPVEGLNWNRVGAFRIEAETSGERSDARLVRIDSWDGLTRRAPGEPLRTNISGVSIEGAWMVSP
ncbi:hypothetical protein J0H33_16480, partial [bacterium]|nr:hypothetical protein [bacterium]